MTIPSWLDVSPSSFAQAREAGTRTGIASAQSSQQATAEAAQRGQQNRQEGARLDQQGQLEGARIGLEGQQIAQQGALESARIIQSAAQAAQQLAFEKQKLQAQQQQTAMEFQVGEETSKQNFMVKQTQDAVNNAYRQAQIGLGQQRIDQTAQKVKQDLAEKAQALADRQSYAMAVAGGMTPAEALAKYPSAWTPALAQATAKPGPEQTVTEHFKEVEGKDADVTPGGTRSFLNPMRYLKGADFPAVTNAPAVAGHPAYSVTQKMPVGTSPTDAFRAAAQPSPASGATAPAPSGPSAPGLPKQGDIVNGYVFKGGDPADQKNWIEAPPEPAPIQ
jgi:hypothetical protein